MNINEKIMAFLQSEQGSDDKYCFISKSMHLLNEIENMGYDEFCERSWFSIPAKLYKYFPNKWIAEPVCKKSINYSLQALIDNTVYLQNPSKFDDVYDSDIHIDYNDYVNYRLRLYCLRCRCIINESTSIYDMIYEISKTFYNAYNLSKDLLTAFVEIPQTDIEQLQNQVFSQSVEIKFLDEYKQNSNHGLEWPNAVKRALEQEYHEYKQRLQNTFRISCFTTSPYSQLMWGGSYADSHRGFCIEYQVDKNNEQYKEVFHNLFPVIYCKSRPDMAERLAMLRDTGWTKERLWDIYFHGSLRKSFDWLQQDEWRLIMLKDHDSKFFDEPFFPISKVYLGNRMEEKDRAEIIDICKQRNIPYIGVTRSNSIFEMRDCDILCEDCPRYLK